MPFKINSKCFSLKQNIWNCVQMLRKWLSFLHLSSSVENFSASSNFGHLLYNICYIINYMATVLSAQLLRNRGMPRKFQYNFNLLVLTRSASSFGFLRFFQNCITLEPLSYEHYFYSLPLFLFTLSEIISASALLHF